MSFELFNLLPAVYRIRDGQLAQTMQLLTPAEQSQLSTLQTQTTPLTAQQQAELDALLAKAYALWIPNGINRGVFLTVAAAGGAALQPGNQTLANLVTALQNYGNPNVSIQAFSFLETTFGLTAGITYDPAYDATAVEAAVLLQLQQTYSFANRSFGQGVSSDEIAALIQGVTGVIAVNVTGLWVVATSTAGDIGSGSFSISAYNAWSGQALTTPLPRPKSKSHLRICPYTPLASPGALPNPAEILVLDPNPNNVTLGAMQ